METLKDAGLDWLPFFVFLFALVAWTYKLNRDLRSDLRKDMAESKKEIMDRIGLHIHGQDSGEVLIRAIANR